MVSNTQKLAAWSAISEAVIYIAMFIFYGAIWQYPASQTNQEKFAFLADNIVLLSVANLIGYVVFGILLAFLVYGLHKRLSDKAPDMVNIASIFGLVWVGIIISAGMVSNIGLYSVLAIAEQDADQAMMVWKAILAVEQGLGGGNEIVGAMWVFIISIAALKTQQLSKGLNYLGLVVGSAGILTIVPADIFTEIFGISQIVWFIWLGVALLKQEPVN